MDRLPKSNGDCSTPLSALPRPSAIPSLSHPNDESRRTGSSLGMTLSWDLPRTSAAAYHTCSSMDEHRHEEEDGTTFDLPSPSSFRPTLPCFNSRPFRGQISSGHRPGDVLGTNRAKSSTLRLSTSCSPTSTRRRSCLCTQPISTTGGANLPFLSVYGDKCSTVPSLPCSSDWSSSSCPR